MEEYLRVQKLLEIKKQTPQMTGISITFQGKQKPFDAYLIPLDYLIYNKYNGRIGSLVKSYEAQNRPINPENPIDREIIEKFLWDSKPDRNKVTMRSLVQNHQLEYGIVTDKGVIIDGNRRAFLLNKIYRDRIEWEKQNHNVDHCKYFLGVILDAGADPKEISKLETMYQMGQDKKLDYNPIEKYLKCKDLKDKFKFGFQEIADMMGEQKSQIETWYEIMKLMDEYLDYLEYNGIYTRLDKREGQFVDLYNYLSRYSKQSKSPIPDWNYSDIDVAILKDICFDYIRAQYEGKEFRYIAQTSKKEGIFCKGDIWKDFSRQHQKTIKNIKEQSVEELREKNKEADLSNLLLGRDNDWTKLVKEGKDGFEGNLRKSIRRIQDLNEENQPLILVTKARDALLAIDIDVDTFFDERIYELLVEINKVSHRYKTLIKHTHDQ